MDSNSLQYCKIHQESHPTLRKLAMKYLTTPSSASPTLGIERLCNIGGKTFFPDHCCLGDRVLEWFDHKKTIPTLISKLFDVYHINKINITRLHCYRSISYVYIIPCDAFNWLHNTHLLILPVYNNNVLIIQLHVFIIIFSFICLYISHCHINKSTSRNVKTFYLVIILSLCM